MALPPLLLTAIANPKSPTLKKSYALGTSTFLGNLQTQVVHNHVNNVQSNSVTFRGIILASYEAKDSAAKTVTVGGNSSTIYTVIVKIPGIHDHLPDPTEAKDPRVAIGLYPRFEGPLNTKPQVGGIATVTFLDPNNKQKKEGNGKILEVLNPGVEGLPLANEINSRPALSAMQNMKQTKCQFNTFTMIPAIDTEKEPEQEQDKPTPSSPPTVNSSFRTAKPKIKHKGNTEKSTATAPVNNGTPDDLNSSRIDAQDCAQKYLMSEYKNERQNPMNVHQNITDARGIYPRYPLATSGWHINQETGKFGIREHPIYKTKKLHKGVDISGPNITGIPVLSSLPGTVVKSGFEGSNAIRDAHGNITKHGSGAGNTVMVHHEHVGLWTFYFHLQALFVSVGDVVGYGTALGSVDTTGGSSGPHLHYEVRKTRFASKIHQFIDPEIFLKTKYRYFTATDESKQWVAMTQDEATKKGIDGLNNDLDIDHNDALWNYNQMVGISDEL